MFGENEWQRAEQAKHGPEHYDDQKPVPQTQFPKVTFDREPADYSSDKRDCKGIEEGSKGAIAIYDRYQHGRQHGGTEYHQQDAKDALNDEKLHGLVETVGSVKNKATMIRGHYVSSSHIQLRPK